MEQYFNIIFNLDKNQEIVTYKKIFKKDTTYYSEYLISPEPQKIEIFLINYLNTDMHNRTDIEKFITKYCFEYYYSLVNKNYKEKYINYTFSISEDEYKEYLDKIYKEDFIWAYETFCDIALKKYRYSFLYKKFKYENPELSKDSKKRLDTLVPTDYFEDLNDDDLKESIGEIRIDFNFSNYFCTKLL